MRVEFETIKKLIIPDGYEVITRDQAKIGVDMVHHLDLGYWSFYMNPKYDFGKDAIFIRKKIVVPTTPGSFYIFQEQDGTIYQHILLYANGWQCLHPNGHFHGYGGSPMEEVIQNWMNSPSTKLILAHDAGNPQKS